MSSSIRSGQFYGVWPVLDGKPLNLQWGEERSNTAETKALVRGSFQDIEDGADSLNALRALIGQAFGEQGFDNKYRLMYDKISEEFCAQKNDGTEAVPIWQDVWCIRFSDGQFQVVSEGGIQSNAGFYGPLPHDLLAIGEILNSGALGGTQFKNPNELYFGNGFYLTSVTAGPRAGKPIVNLSYPVGQSNTFPKSGKEWVVAHNYNTSPIMVQAMTENDVVIIPDKIDVSNRNIAYFYFNEVTSGKALLSSGGLGALELVSALAITDGSNSYTRVEDLNFSGADFYLSSDLAGSPVVNLTDIDHGLLGGLADDDHTQYPLVDMARGFDNVSNAPGTLTLSSGLSGTSVLSIVLQDRGVSKWSIKKNANNDFAIRDIATGSEPVAIKAGAASDTLHIAATSRIGIGTTSPEATLHVAGHGHFDEQVMATAFYTTGAKTGEVLPLTVTDATNPFTDVETLHFNDANFYMTERDGQPVINVHSVDISLGDHGSLQGLADDDHSAYPTLNMDRADFDQATDASIASVSVSSGLTAEKTSQFALKDRGTTAWTMRKNQNGIFFIQDVITNSLPFKIEVGAADDTFVIDTNSRVGIGLSNPAELFHVAGRSQFDDDLIVSSGNGPTVLAINGSAGSSRSALDFKLNGVSKWRISLNASDQLLFEDNADGTVPILIEDAVPTDTLRLTAGGRVGIGVAAPSATLEVAGHGRFSEQLEATAFYLQPGSGGGMWKSVDDVVVDSKDGDIILQASTNSSIVIDAKAAGSRAKLSFSDGGALKWTWGKQTDNSFALADEPGEGTLVFKVETGAQANTLFIDGGSKIGIGTATPTDKLHVAGRGRFDDQVQAEAFYITSGGNWNSLGINVDGVLNAQDTFTSALSVTGTVASTDDITVTKFGQATLNLDGTNGFWRAAVLLGFNGTAKWSLKTSTQAHIQLTDEDAGQTPFLIENNAPDNALYVTGAGHVGMGTATPTARLHVTGDGRFDDKVYGEAFYLASGGDWGDTGIDLSGTLNVSGTGRFDGNLGHGITPLFNLHVFEDTNAQGNVPIAVLENDGDGDVQLGFLLTATSFWGIGIDHGDSNKFKIQSSQSTTWTDSRITIKTTGEVGIGTDDPGTPLEVNGAITADTFVPAAVPDITGSHGDLAALIDLLASLAVLGLITDNSTS